MADIAGVWKSNQSFNPKFNYTISYSETGRSATAVTYAFTVKMVRENGSYGYDIKINWNIGGATGSKTILATGSGASTATATFNVTASTNASGGTLSARIYTSSTTDPTHSQNVMDTGTQTVNKSTFNTAPTLSGTVTADGSTSDKYIAENKASIAISWPAATDPNSNLSGYRIRVSINGGGWTDLATTNSSTRSYTHTVSSYGEGTTFKYAVDSYDSYSARSSFIFSPTLTKNKFTGSSISSTGKINFSTTSIAFTVGASSNTDGSGTSGRYITCNGVTVHNNTIGTGTVTVTIYKSGTTPSGPYVKFDDIKNTLAAKNYIGVFSFNVLSTNAYGTNRTSSVSINIDLRTNPNTVTNIVIAKNSNSTAYRTITATGNSYFIPDGSRTIYVSWSAGSGKLGEAVKYQVYVSIGGGSWTLLSDRQTGLNYTYKPSKLNAASTIKFKIRTITGYDYYADLDSSAENLHYYNSPGLTYANITRTATSATVPVTVKSASSIPNINTVGSWICYLKGTSTKVSEANLTTAQTAQNVSATGLAENSQYDLKVTYNDNTGFSSAVTVTIPIGANSPIFFVNQYGIGVGGSKATSTHAVNVSGMINSTGANSTNGFIARNANKYVKTYIANDSFAWIETDATSGLYSNQSLYVKGEIYAGGNYGNRVYHTGYKPTAADVGALASGGKAVSASSADVASKVSSSADTDVILMSSAAEQRVRFTKGSSSTWDTYFYSGSSTSAAAIGLYDATNSRRVWAYENNGNFLIERPIIANSGITINSAAIVSQGSNTNGNWVRYYDGTQICYVYRTVSMAISNAYGSLFQNTDTWAFPATFIVEPIVNVGRCRWGTSASWGTMSERTTTGCTVRGMDVANRAAGNTTQEIMAIGRWK